MDTVLARAGHDVGLLELPVKRMVYRCVAGGEEGGGVRVFGGEAAFVNDVTVKKEREEKVRQEGGA